MISKGCLRFCHEAYTLHLFPSSLSHLEACLTSAVQPSEGENKMKSPHFAMGSWDDFNEPQ